MRYLSSIAVLALALLPGSNANFLLKQRAAALRAELGLGADGTPLESASIHRLTARDDPVVPTQYIELPIDHFGKNNGTFLNRYWVNTAGYKPGGPIFVYDMGETSEEVDPDITLGPRLLNDNAVFKQLIHEFNGIGILWEHRGYGKSWNAPISNRSTPRDLQFITYENAIQDLVVFIEQFSVKGINETLTPDQRPWIHYGGSSAGVRAAMLRNKRPGTLYAAWASSAPLQHVVDFSQYFDGVWDGLVAFGFGNCTRDIQAVVRHVDNVLETGNEDAKAKLKAHFLGLSGAHNPDGLFAESWNSLYLDYQAQGVDGSSFSLRDFCNHLSTDPQTKQVAPKEGWVATKGIDWTLSRWTEFAPYLDQVNSFFNTSCTGNATATDCTFNQNLYRPSDVLYLWQTCTQTGMFQSANVGDKQLIPKANTPENMLAQCNLIFPDRQGILPVRPKTDELNRYTGGWHIYPANTFFTYGEYEPWLPLGKASKRPDAPKNVTITTKIPECNTLDKHQIFGSILKDQIHCYDVISRITNPVVLEARALFKRALRQWLTCFVPKKKQQ
ncbi:Serine peptidase family S28 [Pyrenophora teres f. maculata]|nr:Serine peptidase family S28 [Pyrenophora teres f. maculata]